MVTFLGRTDVRGVRYRVTDRQTAQLLLYPRCACAPRVNNARARERELERGVRRARPGTGSPAMWGADDLSHNPLSQHTAPRYHRSPIYTLRHSSRHQPHVGTGDGDSSEWQSRSGPRTTPPVAPIPCRHTHWTEDWGTKGRESR